MSPQIHEVFQDHMSQPYKQYHDIQHNTITNKIDPRNRPIIDIRMD